MKRRINDAILAELDALRDEEGRLSPQIVVARARDPKSVLHRYFEWDDLAAAEAHRLDQARGLIRRVRIDLVIRETEIRTVAYLRDPSTPGREPGYLRTSDIEPRSGFAREVVLQELGRVASALSRARLVAVSLDLVEEIDDLLSAVAGLRVDLGSEEEEEAGTET